MNDKPKSPAEELVDLVVFAPIGFALETLERMPQLVERGRKQASFAQSIGKMALGGLGKSRRPTAAPKPAQKGPEQKDPEQKNTAKRPQERAAADAAAGEDTAGADADSTPTEPLAGYATMTAREVIASIGDLDSAGLHALETAETVGKNRVTVLRAITAELKD